MAHRLFQFVVPIILGALAGLVLGSLYNTLVLGSLYMSEKIGLWVLAGALLGAMWSATPKLFDIFGDDAMLSARDKFSDFGDERVRALEERVPYWLKPVLSAVAWFATSGGPLDDDDDDTIWTAVDNKLREYEEYEDFMDEMRQDKPPRDNS